MQKAKFIILKSLLSLSIRWKFAKMALVMVALSCIMVSRILTITKLRQKTCNNCIDLYKSL